MDSNVFADEYGAAWREAAQAAQDLNRQQADSPFGPGDLRSDLRPQVRPEVFVSKDRGGGFFEYREVKGVRAVGARIYIETEQK